MKRVLFVYANMGAGHRATVIALRRAMQALTPTPIGESATWEAESYDPITACDSTLLKRAFGLYAPVTRKVPALFSLVYRLSDTAPVCRSIRKAMWALLGNHLVHHIRTMQPDLVVCVNSLLTYPVRQALQTTGSAAPLFMVVTDLASIHHSWAVSEVDRCFVPTPLARRRLIDMGMDTAKLRVSGLPIDPAYVTKPSPSTRELARTHLGIHPRRFTVLLVAGGEGVGQLDKIANDLARSGLPLQLIVVTGRNEALFRALATGDRALRTPHLLLRYADNMPELMRAAHVIVTKAGSVTIAEALASGLPVVVSNVIEGQERENVSFLMAHGVGCRARTGEDVVRSVEEILLMSPASYDELGERAFCSSNPRAAFEVAQHILETLRLDSFIEPEQLAVR